MISVQSLVTDVAAARARYLDTLGTPTPAQATFKPGSNDWCLVEITEHITLAEQVGINGMWKALEGYRRGAHPVLEQLADALRGVDLAEIIYPHPISGPLDAQQRREFLRFHLDRHRDQIIRVRSHAAFPSN